VEEELDFPFAMTWNDETVGDSGNIRWRLRSPLQELLMTEGLFTCSDDCRTWYTSLPRTTAGRGWIVRKAQIEQLVTAAKDDGGFASGCLELGGNWIYYLAMD
jgi:hypothetical protein